MKFGEESPRNKEPNAIQYKNGTVILKENNSGSSSAPDKRFDKGEVKFGPHEIKFGAEENQ